MFLDEVLEHILRLYISLSNDQTLHGFWPHAKLLELLMGCTHHSHSHHAGGDFVLQVETGRVTTAMRHPQAMQC
eukprot:Skav214112  [mRNA]  locus=scaffold1185:355520:357399:+ [translate_table: standard]